MLERKRKNKTYDIVPGEAAEDVDVELGEGPGLGAQESGVIDGQANGGAAAKETDVTEELDNWDENEEDWEEEAEAAKVAAGVGVEEESSKKRAD